jgi:hypothetical protein
MLLQQQRTILNYNTDCPLDAALTDNGHQKCAIIHEKGHCYYGIWRIFTVPDVDVPMTCVEGYSASFNLKSGVVKYWYSGFEGSFTTGYAPYWSAKVWGC